MQRGEGDEDGRDEDRMLDDMLDTCRRPCQDAWDSSTLCGLSMRRQRRHSNFLRCTRCTHGHIYVLNSSPTLLQISSSSYPRQAFTCLSKPHSPLQY